MTPGTHFFEARLRDAPVCRGGRFCGTGTLEGIGAVKTQLVLERTSPGPGTACIRVTGKRTFTLASDAKSFLLLSVKGTVCGPHAWGTFKVVTGSGVFAAATGSGVIVGTLTKTHHESLRYWGVLTLARK
jgi:hypothetical protein